MNHQPKTAFKTGEPAGQTTPQGRGAGRNHRILRVALMALAPLLLVLGGGVYWLQGGGQVMTENAQVQQARITLSASVAGRIVRTEFQDDTPVKRGDPLFQVDPVPYRLALQRAEAALASTRLQIAQLKADLDVARAQAQVVDSDIAYFQSEFDRQNQLSDRGIASAMTLDEARYNLRRAQENKLAAQEAVKAALAALGGRDDLPIDSHPSVLTAAAERDQAAYALENTLVRAPADGTVYQADSVKPGQFVQPGEPLFVIVETDALWVEANFKETQLTHVTVGQQAHVTVDSFPSQPLGAVVDSIGAGTGAEFALLPAQNATGNWVKVTQRIPVRLRLVDTDPALLARLRTGMSAEVSVETGVNDRWPDWLAALLGQ